MRSSGIMKGLQSPVVIDRTPRLCASPQELRAGDRLIFIKSPTNRAIGGKITTTQQSMLNEEGGHSEACHTAFVVNVDGDLKLAHLMGDGFYLESLADPESKYASKYLKKTTIIFRPVKHIDELNRHLTDLVKERIQHESNHHAQQVIAEGEDDVLFDMLMRPESRRMQNDPGQREAQGRKVRERILESVNKLKSKFQLKWSVGVAIRSFFHRLVSSLRLVNIDPASKFVEDPDKLADTVIAKDSICSKYDADTYVSASNRMTKADPLHRDFRSIFMNASTFTTPKTLWAYLARNVNYEYLVMPHARGEIFNRIIQKIQMEVLRLKESHNVKSQNKGLKLEQRISQFDMHNYPDEFVASIALLKQIKSILLTNTGSGIRVPASYKRVMLYARQQGIYPEHVNRRLVEPERHHVTQLAAQHYGYQPAQAKQYSRYRRLGFSDREAKFECANNPQFGDWYRLSPGRNIALTCTLIGFFGWVLPRGLLRVQQVKMRNAALLQDEPRMQGNSFYA